MNDTVLICSVLVTSYGLLRLMFSPPRKAKQPPPITSILQAPPLSGASLAQAPLPPCPTSAPVIHSIAGAPASVYYGATVCETPPLVARAGCLVHIMALGVAILIGGSIAIAAALAMPPALSQLLIARFPGIQDWLVYALWAIIACDAYIVIARKFNLWRFW